MKAVASRTLRMVAREDRSRRQEAKRWRILRKGTAADKRRSMGLTPLGMKGEETAQLRNGMVGGGRLRFEATGQRRTEQCQIPPAIAAGTRFRNKPNSPLSCHRSHLKKQSHWNGRRVGVEKTMPSIDRNRSGDLRRRQRVHHKPVSDPLPCQAQAVCPTVVRRVHGL